MLSEQLCSDHLRSYVEQLLSYVEYREALIPFQMNFVNRTFLNKNLNHFSWIATSHLPH